MNEFFGVAIVAIMAIALCAAVNFLRRVARDIKKPEITGFGDGE